MRSESVVKPISVAQLKAKFAALGVTDYSIGPCGNSYEIEAFAPRGWHFYATGCHTLVISYYSDFPEARHVAMEDLNKGMVPCPDCATFNCEAYDEEDE
jgi:hypothetical protein